MTIKRISVLLLFLAFYVGSYAQVWSKKMDYPNTLGRDRARAFSIPEIGKGYVIGGWDSIWPLYYFDTYEYDTATNNWTLKAQYPGASTAMATFSINGKGYAGTGVTYSNFDNSFWEYDPAADKWTAKAPFRGGQRAYAVGFSIGGKGYMGGGSVNYDGYTDFYVYDPVTDTWDTMAPCPASGVTCGAVAFSIGGKGYVGTGSYVSTNGNQFIQEKDFWEYDPATNKWTRKADFPGAARGEAMGFSTCDKGYIGGGYTQPNANFVSDFWQYDPIKNKWKQISRYGGGGQAYGVGFSVGKSGYVGMGRDSDRNYKNEYDLWEYHAIVTPAFTTANSTAQKICAGQTITFDDTSNYNPTNWYWQFPGGTPATDTVQNPSVQYNAAGTYNVVLSAWNECDSATITDTNYITVGAGAALDIQPQSPTICNGQVIKLYVNGGGSNFTWSPDTSLSAATGDTVLANPSIETIYTVLGTDSIGCLSMGTDDVAVVPAPNKPTISKSANGDSLISSATQGNQWYFNDTLIVGATNQTLNITGQKTGTYTVEVINPANGCSATSDTLVASGVALLSIATDQLSIYPNPSSGEFYVVISPSVQNIKDWSIELTDVLGRKVFSLPSISYHNKVELPKVAGVYFIAVENKTDRGVFPVVKQ